MCQALRLATEPLTSIGVDTWGCDYALVDSSGALVETRITTATAGLTSPVECRIVYREV